MLTVKLVPGGGDNPLIESLLTDEVITTRILVPDGVGGVVWVDYLVENLSTAEFDPSRRLAPDGVGGLQWVAAGAAALKTRLIVTGGIVSGTTLSTTASGVNYTHNGDATSLAASQVLFRATHSIRIQVNGVEQDKETAILWVSATTFQLINLSLNAGDIITIYN